jgi:predicted dehydrogenase
MLHIGIIGYGGFGHFLHRSWSDLPGISVRAIADLQLPDGALGDVRSFSRWQELLEDPTLDVVSIATPPASHAAIACAAMEAGKHVLIEKPLATTVEDGLRIIATRDRTGRVAMVNYMQRFNPLAVWIADACRRECFGKLRRVAVENVAQDEDLPSDHWFWDREVSGGILVEHAVHFMDLVQYWTQAPPLRVHRSAVSRNGRQQDRVVVHVEHEDGCLATHAHSFSRPRFFEKTEMRLVFDLADINLEGWIPLSGRIDALVGEDAIGHVARLPGLDIRERSALPEGKTSIVSGGTAFPVEERIEATFRLPDEKPAVYRTLVRAVLLDLEQRIDDPRHIPRITLEDGLLGLRTAIAPGA